MKQLKKVLCTTVLATYLAFTPNLGIANTSTWTQREVVREGATSVYKGVQKQGGAVFEGIATMRPTLDLVTKNVIKTAGGVYAVSFAVDQLLSGIDWIFENSHARFTTKDPVYCLDGYRTCFVTFAEVENYARTQSIWAINRYDFKGCELLDKTGGNKTAYVCSFIKNGDGRGFGVHLMKNNVLAVEVASKIIENADSGDSNAKAYLGTIADSNISTADKEQMWNSSKQNVTPVPPIVNPMVTLPSDTSKPNKPNQCKPCQPYPVGTIGYIGPETDKSPRPQIFEKMQHYHMYKVNQNPKNCECHWNDNKDFHHHYTGPIHYKWINLNGSPKRPPDYPH